MAEIFDEAASLRAENKQLRASKDEMEMEMQAVMNTEAGVDLHAREAADPPLDEDDDLLECILKVITAKKQPRVQKMLLHALSQD